MTQATCSIAPGIFLFWSEFSFEDLNFYENNSKYLFKLITVISHPETTFSTTFIYINFNKPRIIQSGNHFVIMVIVATRRLAGS